MQESSTSELEEIDKRDSVSEIAEKIDETAKRAEQAGFLLTLRRIASDQIETQAAESEEQPGLVSCPDPRTQKNEKGSGDKGRTSAS